MNNGHLKLLKEYEDKLTPSNQSTKYSGGTSNILEKERLRASFKTEEMTNLLDGSKANTARRRFIRSPMEKIDYIYRYSMSRPEVFADCIKEFIHSHKKFPKIQPTRRDLYYMNQVISPGGSSLTNHMSIFLGTIMGQGDEEQNAWWFQRTLQFKIIGSYAQTELGHGSNVRGLQTTAIYDKQTQEFILETPTLQSIKWWPGALGKAATHCVLYAQLIIDGKKYGVHVFMVQIRDENFNPLPGVLVGDLGNKVGDNCNDTGFLVLDKIRIPRRFMLMKHAQVEPDGSYKRKAINKLAHYQTMINTRASMSRGSGSWLAKACTIAARWSAIRRQGFLSSKSGISYKSEEMCILDYKIQQYRVIKQISFTYAFKIYGLFMENLSEGDYANNIDFIKEYSAISSGMKSVLIKYAVDGIEDLRKTCGGAGYLLNSGIGSQMTDYIWQITADGDYVILSLLTGKYLLKQVMKTMAGQEQKTQLSQIPQSVHNPEAYHDNLNYVCQWFKYRALSNICTTAKRFQELLGEYSIEEASNLISLDLYDSTTAHCLYYLLTLFIDFIEQQPESAIKSVLQRLCAMFACSNFQDDKWTHIIPFDQMVFIKQAILKLMNDIRPDVITLVDAFDIPDSALSSTIGRKDGNVYEALFRGAVQSPLNQTDPFQGYDKVLEPHLDKEFLKLKNTLTQAKL